MNLLVFTTVWVATWATCWFVLVRWWPRRLVLTSAFDDVVLREVQAVGRRSTWQVERGTWYPGERRRIDAIGHVSGARAWAPLIATAVAFAVEGVLRWIV